MATLEELARLYLGSRMSGGGWPMVAPSVGPGAFAGGGPAPMAAPPPPVGAMDFASWPHGPIRRPIPPDPNEVVDAVRFTGNMPLGNRPTAMDFGAPYPPPPAGGWGGPVPASAPSSVAAVASPPRRPSVNLPRPPALEPRAAPALAPMSWWQRNAALQREGPGGAYIDPEAAARVLAGRG